MSECRPDMIRMIENHRFLIYLTLEEQNRVTAQAKRKFSLLSHTPANRNECPCCKHFLTTPANTSILSLSLKNQNFKFVTLTRAPSQPVALFSHPNRDEHRWLTFPLSWRIGPEAWPKRFRNAFVPKIGGTWWEDIVHLLFHPKNLGLFCWNSACSIPRRGCRTRSRFAIPVTSVHPQFDALEHVPGADMTPLKSVG